MLNKILMSKKIYWTMRDGSKISVDDMDVNHLRNVLKMILRNIEQKKTVKKYELKLNGEIAQSMIDDAMEQELFDTLSDKERMFYGL